MNERKFFLKYLAKEFWTDIKKTGKGIKGLLRPKIWFIIAGAALIVSLFYEKRTEAIISVLLLLFVWGWDIYEAGAWKYEYRKENIKRIREKVKDELPEYEKRR